MTTTQSSTTSPLRGTRSFRSVESLRNADAFRASDDAKRGAFLRALDDSEFSVDDWEAQFIGSFLDFTSNRPSDEPRWWTPGRRASTDRMVVKYPEVARECGLEGGARVPASRGSSVASPHLSSVASPHHHLDLPSVAGQCDYLVRGDDRRQRRCGQPATVTLRAGLQLCAAHEAARQEGIERLRKFKARQLRS